ncbi:hypothetical protein [Rhodoferax sp.]|uniref:hypothetical protein n=1 Tax=Rhodoferax sp. TaxID=50421 RepID=UPI0025E77A18|nr:hypothetical protein [Rhodoferax sp.]MCM2342689.1 hypothetical protein [Rhodoferax sp.]
MALLTVSDCAVTRDQQTVGAYIDDTTITGQIKSRFFENKEVAGAPVSALKRSTHRVAVRLRQEHH